MSSFFEEEWGKKNRKMIKDQLNISQDFRSMGLVLEGGGMRGVFTVGVLDYLMDKQIYFPYAVGVSAGACNGLSYMSRQRGRAKYSNIDLLKEYKYIGIRHLFRKKSIMDMDLLFRVFPEQILPYDYDAYFSNEDRFEMVTSNCLTGEAVYFEEKSDRDKVIDICRASSSLPFVCPITYVDEVPMLDGGICDSIPIERAIGQGYNNNVIVLTRNKGFRKKEKDIKIPSFIYRKYPAIREALQNRNMLYNQQLARVEELEDQGKVFVIRPDREIEVDRMERNTDRLLRLYEEGYQIAEKCFTSSKSS